MILDSHVEGSSLLQVLGESYAETTDFFLLNVRDDLSLVLSQTKLKGLDTNIGDKTTGCDERVGIHKHHNYFTYALAPEWEENVCKLF